jgi:plastocyanin
MKKNYLFLFLAFTLNSLLIPGHLFATHFFIATGDSKFEPDTLNLLVGDTITWQWVNGNHTTTSNGIPEGATPWNELLDSLHTSFTYIIPAEGVYKYISVPDLPGMQGMITATYHVGIHSPQLSITGLSIFPNPSNGHFTLEFSLPAATVATITLCDQLGRVMKVLSSEQVSATFKKEFDLGPNLLPGVYFIRVECDGATTAKPITLVN